ncbi:MAG: hypothetical protein ACD_76C00094G0040 [uncultured bacterium]|nr:MAG: hypothetical protein ACD_76C00094G0040 [uncultured bacterium]HBD04912.1 hypothetical protein [Candidatus Uhrbacteria bacterium]
MEAGQRSTRYLDRESRKVNEVDLTNTRFKLFVVGQKVRVFWEDDRICFWRSEDANNRVRVPHTDDVALRAHIAIEIWNLLTSALPEGIHLQCLGYMRITPSGEEWRDYTNTGPGFISREIEDGLNDGHEIDWKYIDFMVVNVRS